MMLQHTAAFYVTLIEGIQHKEGSVRPCQYTLHLRSHKQGALSSIILHTSERMPTITRTAASYRQKAQYARILCDVWAIWIPCFGLQGVHTLEPVLKDAPRQRDAHIFSFITGVDGFLEHRAPADGGRWHIYG